MSPAGGDDAPLTYSEAGVDIAAGEKAVEFIKDHVRSTFRAEVLGDLGGFGGLFAVDWKRYKDPLLVSSTDGVGTKSQIAHLTGRLDTIGIDLVAMSVDDVAAQGAEPLFFLDYISIGKVVPEQIEQIVGGVADGCRQAGCALLGGEMSEHPGLMQPGEFDLVGFCVGVVDRGAVLPRSVSVGDRIVAFASLGLRCNGYALARRALLDRGRRSLEGAAWPGAHHTLGAELLRPSVIYAKAMLALARRVPVHAFAHITGGGMPGNINRVLPHDCDALIRRGTWEEPRIFEEIQRDGNISDSEMENVFNLGVGMVAVVPAGEELHAVDEIRSSGHDSWVVGEVTRGSGQVQLNA